MRRYLKTWLAVAATVSTVVAGSSTATEPAGLKPSAIIQKSEGRAFVRVDKATRIARKDMPVFVGNRIIAVGKANVVLVYPDGCTVSVPQNSQLVVGKQDQCSSKLADVKSYTCCCFLDKPVGPITAAAVGSNWYYATQLAVANALIGSGVPAATAMSAAASVLAASGVGLVVVAGTAVVVGIEAATSRPDNTGEVLEYLKRINQPVIVTPPVVEVGTQGPLSS